VAAADDDDVKRFLRRFLDRDHGATFIAGRRISEAVSSQPERVSRETPVAQGWYSAVSRETVDYIK
jgi:hypothetical protein